MLVLLDILAAAPSYCSSAANDPVGDVKELLQMIAPASPDSCELSEKPVLNPDGSELAVVGVEVEILKKASKAILDELNGAGPDPGVARIRATAMLKKLEGLSREINAGWSDEDRLHFELLDFSSALVLKASIGTQAKFFVFGFPEKVDTFRPHELWEQIGEEELDLNGIAPRSLLEIHPLHGGPSGNPRFLAQITYFGCTGSSSLLYDAREWNPKERGELNQIIKQEGAEGMDEGFTGAKPTRKDPFLPIGKLETKGSIITLPYCWFSAIDTWDNPSLCTLDTYDLSGDTVRFRSRSFNRPDLLPIAKAIEYAEKHDYPAVLAYCANADVARRIVNEMTPSYFAGDLRVTRKADGSEHIEMGFPKGDRFDVRKTGDRWLVVGFTPGSN